MTPDIDATRRPSRRSSGRRIRRGRFPYHVAGRSGAERLAAGPGVLRLFWIAREPLRRERRPGPPRGRGRPTAVRPRRRAISISSATGFGRRESAGEWTRRIGQRADLPRVPDHTWRAGLDRLLLGYALPGGGTRLFAGVLPYDEVEGEAAAVLGGWCLRRGPLRVAAELRRHGRCRPGRIGCGARGGLLGPRPTKRKRTGAACSQRSRPWRPTPARQSFAGDVSLRRGPVVSPGPRRGGPRPDAPGVGNSDLLRHGARPRDTLATCLCLVGMNDGAFPRLQRTPGFDLMREESRSGGSLAPAG